jgi:VanZ family protein
VAIYLCVITYLSHQPSLRVPGGLPDWLMHGLEYAGLAALLFRAQVRTGRRGPKSLLAALAGCAAFGLIDEYHQSFVPGRDASLRDALADTTGAALALIGASLIHSVRGGRTKEAEITIYGRVNCHLCDEAMVAVKTAAAGYAVRIRKIDVDGDEALRLEYGDQVPVVTVNDRKVFKFRVDQDRLRRILASLQHRSGS